MEPATGLAGLFVSSFLSATLLPGSSEVVLVSVLRAWPDLHWPALGLATLGNTLGGLTTYLMGRFVPRRDLPQRLHWLQRWGAVALVGSWLPVVGDALCAGAGWLRLNVVASAVWMAAGKFFRYLVIAALV